MDGDTVVVRVSPPAGRRKQTGKREGAIVRIVERAQTKIVGTYVLQEDRPGGFGFVESSNPRITQNIVISREHAGGARPGDIVSAEIIAYPLRNRPPEGKIIRIIGKPGQPGIDSELIIEQYELPVQFSPAVLREADSIAAAGDACHAQGPAGPPRTDDRNDRRRKSAGLRRRHLDPEDQDGLPPLGAYRRRGALRGRRHAPGPGGLSARHQRVPPGPRHPHAPHCAFERHLQPQPGSGPADAHLRDGHLARRARF